MALLAVENLDLDSAHRRSSVGNEHANQSFFSCDSTFIEAPSTVTAVRTSSSHHAPVCGLPLAEECVVPSSAACTAPQPANLAAPVLPPHLHQHAHKLGGLACHDHRLREQQQEAIKEWITQIGKNLLTGNGLASTPAPVKIFEARSNLQKITDPWVYTQLLQQAADTTDKTRRLALVAAWFVAGLRHMFDTWKKPFNPLLGETWHGRNACGCEVFLEQVSHHPPVAKFHLKDSRRRFELRGTTEGGIQVSVKYRGFNQTFKGLRVLTFADGDEIDISELPTFATKGVTTSVDLRGDVCGQAVLNYGSAGLVATLAFGPMDAPGDNIYSRTDAVSGTIAARPDAGASPTASVAGSCEGPLELSDTDVKSPFFLFSGSGDSLKGASWRFGLKKGTQCKAMSRDSSPRSTTPGMLNRLACKMLKRGSAASESGDADSDVVASFQGSWLSHLDVIMGLKTERVWTLAACEAAPFQNVPEAERLPSDSSFRPDLIALGRGDVQAAQAAKDELEARQRRERKLRPKTLAFK